MADPQHHILICTTCRAPKGPQPRGATLVQRLTTALPDFHVSGADCMSGCTRPCAIAFRAPNKATYLFGDIDPDADLTDIVTFAQHYTTLPDGWIIDARPLGSLRTKAIARIPAIPAKEPRSRTDTELP